MNRVLRKRILRDLKSNFMRWLALASLIVLGMYMIISMVAAAETIITGTRQRAEQNQVEDGQFSVFLPLTEQQEQELSDCGLTLERMFSMDTEAADYSVLRVMKNREFINLIDLDEGRLAENSNEIVLEKRYCAEHDLHIGDTVSLNGIDLTITGIGSTPDYDMPIRKFSDASVDSSLFGTAFVTEAQYETMHTDSVKAEDYTYAYRLGGNLTDDEVKQKIKDFAFDYTEIADPYFQETIAEKLSKKQDLQEGIQSLYDGSENLKNALSGTPFVSGAEELHKGIGELKSETDELLDELFEIRIENLTAFIKAEDNPRILGAADDLQINKMTVIAAGVIVMVLFTYVICVRFFNFWLNSYISKQLDLTARRMSAS